MILVRSSHRPIPGGVTHSGRTGPREKKEFSLYHGALVHRFALTEEEARLPADLLEVRAIALVELEK